MDGVRDTLTAAVLPAQPGRPGPVGIIGVSLGGYLGLAVAGNDERVGAVVVVCGGLPAVLLGTFTRMPPVLILHGNDDSVVPPSEARALEKWLVERGTPHEVVIYPGEGHHLTGAAADDALKRATAFLQKHLVV
jgi:carboxymethylenebutenolidase